MTRRSEAAPLDANGVALRFEEAGLEAWERLLAWGLLPADRAASPPRLALPRGFAETLARCLALADDTTRLHLDLLYFDAVPSAHLTLFAARGDPHAWLFHTPLRLASLPRLEHAITRLRDRLAAACEALDRPLPEDAWPWQPWLAGATPTLAELYAETYFGRMQPLFGADAHALARLHQETADLPLEARWAVVDRHFASPIFHELMHFSPERVALSPPYLDEAVAAALGVLFDPASALPASEDEPSLLGWPTFAQVGRALTRAFGEDPILLAHAGLLDWDDVLPRGLRAAFVSLHTALFTAAPASHLHPDPARPERWSRLIYLAARGIDPATLTLADLDQARPEAYALPWQPSDLQDLRDALLALRLVPSDVPGRARLEASTRVCVDFARGSAYRLTPSGAAPAQSLLPPSLVATRDAIVATLGTSADDATILSILAR